MKTAVLGPPPFDQDSNLVVMRPFISAGRHLKRGDAFTWKGFGISPRIVAIMIDEGHISVVDRPVENEDKEGLIAKAQADHQVESEPVNNKDQTFKHNPEDTLMQEEEKAKFKERAKKAWDTRRKKQAAKPKSDK